MGRERQKKKNRSSVRKATLKPNGRTKTGKRKVNFLGNPIIAENWDHNLTLTRNYKRLGLSSRLNAPTGGSEKKAIPNDQDGEQPITTDAFAMPKNPNPTTLVTTETKVERDPQTGHILRIIRSDEDCEDATARKRQLNPLNDPLEDLSDQEESSAISTGPNGIVAELEALAEEEGAALARKRRPRQQSKREEEWIARLVGKHGDDIRAMARDVNLNPMQQSEGDLGRRIKKWKENKQMNDRPREL